MLRYGLIAVTASVLIAAALVLLPAGDPAKRPEPRLINGDGTAASGFVIKDAPAPAPATAPTPSAAPAPAGVPGPAAGAAPSPDLDTVIAKLRSTANQPPAASPAPSTPADAPPQAPAPADPAAAPGNAAADPNTSQAATTAQPVRWTNVTGQGTRWRMGRSASGFVVSIDLGNGQVAQVHVLPAFANLGLAQTNVRIDYLRRTILQDFSGQSAEYTYARDGSVSLR